MSGEVAVIVAVRNGGKRPLRFAVDGVSDQLVDLDWSDYKILKGGSTDFVEDVSREPFADGVVPLATLSMSSGDTATMLVFLENVSSENCLQEFVVELRDTSGDVFRSKPFRPCDPQPEPQDGNR